MHRHRWAGSGLALSLALAAAVQPSEAQNAGTSQSRQSSASNVFTLGGVAVAIPPPEGFEEVLSRFGELRQRLADAEPLLTLAAHLPRETAVGFKPGQDLTFYTKVSVSRSAIAVDVSEAMFADLKKRVGDSAFYDQDFLKKYLADTANATGTSVTQPRALGTFDQSPTSLSTMAVSSVANEDRSVTLIMSTSLLHLRHRLVYAYAYRVVRSPKDQADLQEFTKAWVRSMLAANR